MYLALNILHHIIENYAEGFFWVAVCYGKCPKEKNVRKCMHKIDSDNKEIYLQY